MKRTLLLLALLIFVPALLLIIRFQPLRLPFFQSASPSPGAQAEERQRVEQAIRQAIDLQKKAVPAFQIFDTQIDHILFSHDENWATAWLTPVDPQTQQIVPSEPGLAIAWQVDQEWQVALPTQGRWVEQIQKAPDDFLSPQVKNAWAVLAAPSAAAAPAAAFTGYFLPWMAGEIMVLTQSVGHDQYTPGGSAHYAFDFAKPGFPSGMFNVHAAKAGVVSRVVWDQPNGNEANPNYLVLEDTSTNPTTYQLYMHFAQDSIPTELRVVGAAVLQGQLIGIADDTGQSSGNHLHFMVHTYPYSYWGASVDIVFGDVTINGGRPRIQTDLGYCHGEDICNDIQTYYVSGNILLPDDIPPTGGILEPGQSAAIQTRTAHLAGWANDNESGVASAQFYALYNNAWHTVGSPFSANSFALDWDLCSDQVPDGPISLALQIRDYAQNQTEPLFDLRHFTKNYTCPTPPPGCVPSANQVALFADPDYQGWCAVLTLGTYRKASTLSSSADNNAESILVGSNIKATLFSENELLGRSETLNVNDANLADNRVGANSLSSLVVQARTTLPAVPILVYPAEGSTFASDASLSLAWSDATGAALFQARLQGPTALTTTWQTQPFWHLSGLAPGNYTWRVKGKYNSYESAWSSPRSFQVLAAQLPAEPLVPAAASPYTQDFESGAPGWTHNGAWNATSEANHTSAGAVSFKYQPGAGSGYDTGGPNAGYLTSEPVILPADEVQYLRFWYLYATEGAGIHWDQRWVQISTDGQSFSNLIQLSSDAPNYWLSAPVISLASYAGQTIRIRFYFATLDSSLNTSLGWLIDDFTITADPPANCQDADNTYLQASPIEYSSAAGPASASGIICPGGDVDYFKFQGIQGDRIGIRVDAQSLSSTLDTYLYFIDIDGSSVLAENDDILLYQRTDSAIAYVLNRTGTFYIKLRSWDHPTSGGLDLYYALSLFRDSGDPQAAFILPSDAGQVPVSSFNLQVAASDDASGVSHVKFFWHPADWQNLNWIELGDDWNGLDGWNYLFDTRSVPELKGIAFFAMVYDWAGNSAGVGSWNLSLPTVYFPWITRLR